MLPPSFGKGSTERLLHLKLWPLVGTLTLGELRPQLGRLKGGARSRRAAPWRSGPPFAGLS